ncbi:hypothetical protein FPQ18DRAFT_307121 [Pyronema domesticum]|nr:hypothetical protein FPQ18DRAFT_307121 [Pyronema domesticum]
MHFTSLLSLVLLAHASISVPTAKIPRDSEVFPNGAYIRQTEFGEVLTLPADYDFSQPHFNMTLMMELRKRGEVVPPLKGVRPPKHYTQNAAPQFQTEGLTGIVDDILGGGLEASVNLDINIKRDEEGLLPRDAAPAPQTEALGTAAGLLGGLISPVTGHLPREAALAPQTEAITGLLGNLGGLTAPVKGLLPRSASASDNEKRDAPRREWQQGQLVNYDTDRRRSSTTQDFDRRSAEPEPKPEAEASSSQLVKLWRRFLSPHSASVNTLNRRKDFPSSLPKGEIRCETSAGSPETIDLIIISERIAKYPDSQWCCSGPGICQELEAAGTAKVGVCNSKGENHCFHCGPFANAVYLIQEKCRKNFADGGGKGKMGKQSNRAGGFVRYKCIPQQK